jgi:hypothetical protein
MRAIFNCERAMKNVANNKGSRFQNNVAAVNWTFHLAVPLWLREHNSPPTQLTRIIAFLSLRNGDIEARNEITRPSSLLRAKGRRITWTVAFLHRIDSESTESPSRAIPSRERNDNLAAHRGATMSKSQSELRWHLSRGDEPSCLLTECELQHLTELGQLRDTDLLWKPGLHGWLRADAIPGILTPPALPEERVKPIAASSLTAAKQLAVDAVGNTRSWTKHFLTALRLRYAPLAASCRNQFEILDARARTTADQLQKAIASTKALRWMEQPGSIAILLGLTLVFGTLNFAMQGLTVEAAEEVSPITHSAELMHCPQPKSGFETNRSASAADTFAGFALLTDPGVTSEPDSNPTEPVPLPMKKPAKASVDKSAYRAAREPKPMRFGTVGFAYDPQN